MYSYIHVISGRLTLILKYFVLHIANHYAKQKQLGAVKKSIAKQIKINEFDWLEQELIQKLPPGRLEYCHDQCIKNN